MKDLSSYISIATFVILLGYITYSGMNEPSEKDSFSDDGVALEDVGESQQLMAVSIDVPKKFSFAEEDVPLSDPDVRERFDKELQINTYLHSNTLFLIKRANRWLPQIDSVLEKNGIPGDFKYLPLIESALLNDISPKEAVGFWQILKTSGREFGLEITNEVDERYDPIKATVAACKYLNQAKRKLGTWTLAAASYNRGMTGIGKSLENQHVSSYYDLYLNDETSRYVFRILAIKEIIEHPSRYGFKPDVSHLYKREKVRYITVTESIKDLIAFSQKNGINYKLLKRHNPWLREENLPVKKGKSYRIAIPINS
ncbi:MAG: lytic transglycosylase domain-containing protein [Cyclobacteriaceae bacterium]|nr:lytic transglycosylase domain-containing protein [Cyclobacteriaceae bacterium]